MSFINLYLILIPIVFILVINNKKYHAIPFILITILSMIRYDTTTDYSAYVIGFWQIKRDHYSGWFEPGYVLLNKLFCFSIWGFIPLLMLCTFFSYKQIFLLLKKHNIVLIGSFIFLLWGSVTRYENIVRQGIAMGIFFYTFKYIKEGNFYKYLGFCILAFSFHSSALVMLPYYFLIKFLSKIKPSALLSGCILFFFYLLYMTGYTALIVQSIIKILPFYTNYTEKFEITEISSGLILLINTVIVWLPCLLIKEEDENTRTIINISWVTGIGYILVQNYIVLERVVEYLYIFQIIAVSLLLKQLLFQRKRIIALGILFLQFLIFARNTITYYGNNKYYSIFSEKCLDHKFYVRHYLWEDFYKSSDNVDRSREERINP